MNSLFLVAAGGALGASARHLVSAAALRLAGPGWPWGTLTANAVGGVLMGALVGWLAVKGAGEAGRDWRLFLGTGVLGGFTTFSAFALETVSMIERHALGSAAGYVAASVALAVGGVFVGLMLARGAFP